MFLFVAIPFFLLELYLSLKTGETIGFFWSVVWIVLTFLLGLILLKRSPNTILSNMQAVQMGKLNIEKFNNASISYFVGSILLIIPGVLSDFLGIVAFGYTFYLQFIAKITPQQSNNYRKKGDEDVIDVEIVDKHTDSNSHS